MEEIYQIIRHLGVTDKYKGYHYTAEAVLLALRLKDTSMRVTKDIYPRLAASHKVTANSIEHAIRTIVDVAWNKSRRSLEEIAGKPLAYKPPNAEFIAMLTYYISDRGSNHNSSNGI
ncbi:MAG: sporulation initiation factor Spo0A C-terminal domain-containing protein [Clostridiales bacterium]|nr:sporulation initiation factor Spo0A C-terminal domain-containing protein [Candidatus Blautia equi]